VGSDVLVQGLDHRLALAGTGYFTRTTTDLGSFALEVPLREPFVEVLTTGYYFDEVRGSLSGGPISLRAIAPSEDGVVQVNLLTTLERDRIVALVQDRSLSFADARRRAEEEVLRAFHLPASIVERVPFSGLDMEHGGDPAAALVAVSALVQGSNSEAQLTELIARLSADLAADGALEPGLATLLAAQGARLDPDAIRWNLQARFAALGRDVAVPDLARPVDANRLILPPEWDVEDWTRWFAGARITVDLRPVTPGTIVYYRTDESSTPGPWRTGGAWMPFQIPLLLEGRGTTLVVSAYAQSPFDPARRSEVETRTFTMPVPTTPAPSFAPLTGTYGSTIALELRSAFEDAAIHFTTDGSPPTTGSDLYSGPIPIVAGAPVAVRAFAVAPGAHPSEIVGAWYEVDPAYDGLAWPPFTTREEVVARMSGSWIGRVEAPWTAYGTMLYLGADGTCGDELDEIFGSRPPFLYYGACGGWGIDDVSAVGLGAGSFVVLDVFGVEHFRSEMELAQMSADDRHLRFDLWHGNSGPVHYELTRRP
jgi:hypothetical protein